MLSSLAEPIDDLQKSYEEFLRRIERHKKKKIQVLVVLSNYVLSKLFDQFEECTYLYISAA